MNLDYNTREREFRIAVFASGNGSNAENIALYFGSGKTAKVALILSNSKEAHVLTRAQNLHIPTCVFNHNELYHSHKVLEKLQEEKTDCIVLAGFLLLIPAEIISAFRNRILNIHPALLPKYGGKGMYGMKVHQSVIQNKEKQSGITIHYVNEKYDDGNIIFQATCEVYPEEDSPALLQSRIQELEHWYYPRIIERFLTEMSEKRST
jgi:phosphoribosylglycinamide formyltransferase 1